MIILLSLRGRRLFTMIYALFWRLLWSVLWVFKIQTVFSIDLKSWLKCMLSSSALPSVPPTSSSPIFILSNRFCYLRAPPPRTLLFMRVHQASSQCSEKRFYPSNRILEALRLRSYNRWDWLFDIFLCQQCPKAAVSKNFHF